MVSGGSDEQVLRVWRFADAASAGSAAGNDKADSSDGAGEIVHSVGSVPRTSKERVRTLLFASHGLSLPPPRAHRSPIRTRKLALGCSALGVGER